MVNVQTRAVYGRAVTAAAHVRNPAVEAAFAVVAREDFLGPPPWKLFGDFGAEAAAVDPAALYRDVLVAIDAERGINNGEPQLWALIFDRLDVRAGARVLHVGAGTGYYTALLAELVGPAGAVVAVEVEADLAVRATQALADRPRVKVIGADAAQLTDTAFDRIVFSCGVTNLPPSWLQRLPEGARIAVPFTGADHAGIFFLLARQQWGYDVTPICGVSIYPAAGFRKDHEERMLVGVRRADPEALWSVRSLQPRDQTAPAERIYGFDGYVMTSRPFQR